MNPKTRNRILEIAQRLNYFPDASARQLVKKESRTLVFALPYFAEMIASEPFAKMISGVMSSTTELGYDLNFLIPKEGKLDASSKEFLYGKRLAGIVTAAPDANDEFFLELKKLGVPVVVICTYDPKHEAHHVYCDNEKAAYNAISYLVKNDHRAIGMIKGPIQSSDGNARFRGYLKALKNHEIRINDNLIVGARNFSSEEGYRALKELLARFEKPSALFCANDDLAIGCLKALKDSKIKCPDEISIVGFDNIRLCEFTDPPLTTVEQPFFEMGRQAVQLLMDVIQYPRETPIDKEIDYRFIVRESVRQK